MILDFPQGDLYYSMSDELQYQFFRKMKDAVWAINVKIEYEDEDKDDEEYDSTGFCIDSRGLLLTAAHLIEVKEDKEGSSSVEVNKSKGRQPKLILTARTDKDVNYRRCEIAYELKHFDLLLLKVDGESQCGGFDYVPIHGKISRNIPYGREVFTIGICKIKGFHLLRGMLTYDNKHDETDYLFLAKDVNFEVKRRTEDLNFYNDRPYRVRKGSLASDDMHPELVYLQMQFIGIAEFGGMSGAPIFDSKGRAIGMVQSNQFSLKGVTSAAIEAMVKCYWEGLGEGC